MDKDKVRILKAAEVPHKAQVIELLEQLLEDAKAGDILAFIFIAAKTGPSGYQETFCIPDGYHQSMIGSLEIAKMGIMGGIELVSE